MPEHLLIGNQAIYEMLRDKHGRAPISFSTFAHKYVSDMVRLGVVFDLNFGRCKRIKNCAFPSRVIWYFTQRHLTKHGKLVSLRIIKD